MELLQQMGLSEEEQLKLALELSMQGRHSLYISPCTVMYTVDPRQQANVGSSTWGGNRCPSS